MKQSQRIELCKQYHNHPLKKEYEQKKEKICQRKPFLYYVLWVPMLIPPVMFFVYGYLLISDIGDAFTIIFLGILNVVVGIFFMGGILYLQEKATKSYNRDSLKSLEDEYEQKGLVKMTEQELFNHECCEYDDYREITVCCVTKQPLSYRDYNFCSTSGNCKYCKTFVSAYLGPDAIQYWSYEFKK